MIFLERSIAVWCLHIMSLILFACAACVIHWSRQIKEVLSSQDAFETAENSGPLDEIEFWQNRCADLSGISTQLDNAGVKRIAHVLDLAKSSYVAPFLRLAGQIKVRPMSQFQYYDGWMMKMMPPWRATSWELV